MGTDLICIVRVNYVIHEQFAIIVFQFVARLIEEISFSVGFCGELRLIEMKLI